MEHPDDKSLKHILNRVIGNLARHLPQEEKPARAIRPHESDIGVLRLIDTFGWPAQQERNDIHANISRTRDILKSNMTYSAFKPTGEVNIHLMVTRVGLYGVVLRSGNLQQVDKIEIPFRKFSKGDSLSQSEESHRILDKLEDKGFAFFDQEQVLQGLKYILSTWIEEAHQPIIECPRGPEPHAPL